MISFFKKNWLILLIIALSLILRLWGCWYGLPGLYVGDEKSLVGGALKMIYERTVFPVSKPSYVFRILYYPVLIPWIYLIIFVPYAIFIYLTGNFASLTELRDFFIMNPSRFFLFARIINVFFSTASVYLIFLITKKIFSKRAGLIAALLVAVAWLPIHQGHFSKHWNIGMFFALLVWYFSLWAGEKKTLKSYLRVGLLVGLAGFANYIAAIYGIFLAIIHFFFDQSLFKKKLLDKKIWLFVLVALTVFSLSVTVYPQEFYRMAIGEDSTVKFDKSLAGFWSIIVQIIKVLFYLETFIFIPALIGYLFLFFKNKKQFLTLLFIPLLAPFLYYFIFHFEPRYVLLFLPILTIAAGFGIDELFRILRVKSNLAAAVICSAIIFLPLKNAVIFDKILSQEDTRNLAREWIENNLPAGTKIITNSWEFDLIKNQECLEQQQKVNNMSLRSRDYVMIDRLFPDSYCVWNLDLIKVLPPDVEKYQYYLIDEHTGQRFAYLGQILMERAELVKKFEGSPFDPTEQAIDESKIDIFVHQRLKDRRTGPTVEIYKLK